MNIPNIAGLKSIVGKFGNPFTQNLSMAQRTKFLGATGALEIGVPMVTQGVGGGLGHAFGSLDGLIGLASLSLLIPGFVFTPVGAALFAFAVVGSAFKAGKHILGAIGSLLSGDIMGVLLNTVAAAGYAISALPIGSLFKNGLAATKAAIVAGTAGMKGGATVVSNVAKSTTTHLYGEKFTEALFTTGGWQQLGKGVAGRAQQGYGWVLAGA